MKKTIFIILLILIFFPLGVFAENSAGNYIDSQSSGTENITGPIDRDAYIFSANTYIKDANIGRSLINCSYSCDISNTVIGDSLRSCSQSLIITDTTIDNNLTVVAQNIEIRGNSIFNAIYGAANNIVIGGTTNAINVVGDTITLEGIVLGDVNINANNIIIKSTTNIQGNLNISSGNQPVIEDGAVVANTNFNQLKPEVNVKSPLQVITDTLIDIAYWTVVTIIIAFMIIILAGSTVKEALVNLKNHLVAIILTGLVSLILIPIICVILIFPYITIPITLIISTAYILIVSICIPFTAAVVGRWILPKLNKWLSTLIFGLIFGVVSRIPFIAIILNLVCMIITLGIIIYKLYENILQAFRNLYLENSPRNKQYIIEENSSEDN